MPAQRPITYFSPATDLVDSSTLPQVTYGHLCAAMKRKNFDISSYIGSINIRFEPVTPVPAIETIKDPSKIPSEYKHYLISGSIIHFVRYPFGIIFSQKVIVRHQAFWLHVFYFNQTTTLKPITNALLISINYLIKGRLDCIVNDERLIITENKYQLYALADSIAYQATLDAGLTVDFHTTVPEHMITQMQQAYDDVPLDKLYELSFQGMFLPHLFKIRSSAKKHIQKILGYKHATTSREQLARHAAWEQHLAALFANYVNDKNNHASRVQWENSDRLRVRDLPVYIEQNLSDYHASSTHPLQLQNVLRQVKLREHEFKRAVRKEYNATWKSLIHKVRMQKAAELLTRNPSLSISDIAAQLGYSYHTHFTRAFKTYYDCTPENYRDNII